MVRVTKMPPFSMLSIVLLVGCFILAINRLQYPVYRKEPPRELSHRFTTPQSTALYSHISTSDKRPTDKVPRETNLDSLSRNETRADSNRRTARFCDKHKEQDVGPCIFDVGLNTGQDTIQYLESSPVSRVVGVEANPHLIDHAKERFRDELSAGRLKLVNIGLVGNASEAGERRPKLAFWINSITNEWSSFRQTGGCRGPGQEVLPAGNTTYCRKIEMDTMSCSELIEEYGTPIYMKVDIEGMDRSCVQALANIAKKDRPKYISIENVWKKDIGLFSRLGYTGFKIVNQKALQKGLYASELDGNSGPWGEDAKDLWLGKKWHSREDIMARLPLPATIVVRGEKIKGWFDLHGKK